MRSRPLSKKEINRMCASIVSMPDSKRVKIRGGMLYLMRGVFSVLSRPL